MIHNRKVNPSPKHALTKRKQVDAANKWGVRQQAEGKKKFY